MKITLEFEHSHELIDLLKSLGSSLKKDEPTCGIKHIDIHELIREDERKHSEQQMKNIQEYRISKELI